MFAALAALRWAHSFRREPGNEQRLVQGKSFQAWRSGSGDGLLLFWQILPEVDLRLRQGAALGVQTGVLFRWWLPSLEECWFSNRNFPDANVLTSSLQFRIS